MDEIVTEKWLKERPEAHYQKQKPIFHRKSSRSPGTASTEESGPNTRYFHGAHTFPQNSQSRYCSMTQKYSCNTEHRMTVMPNRIAVIPQTYPIVKNRPESVLQ